MSLVRRVAAVTGAALFAVAAMVGGSAGPAMASQGPCYAHGSFSFKNDFYSSTTRKIHVFHGTSCTGGEIGTGTVGYNASTNSIGLTYNDNKCDGYAIAVYTHGFSVRSNPATCGTSGSTTHPYSAYGNPKNFWVNVAGTTNSDAVAFPV